MAVLEVFKNLAGTVSNKFKIGVGTNSVLFRMSGGMLGLRKGNDTGDVNVTLGDLYMSGFWLNAPQAKALFKNLEVQSGTVVLRDAGNTTNLILKTPTLDAARTITLPSGLPSAGMVLTTDANGNWYYGSGSGDTSMCVKQGTTNLSFGSVATIDLDTVPAGAQITSIDVIVNARFAVGAQVSIGDDIDRNLYLDAYKSDLAQEGIYSIDIHSNPLPADSMLKAYYTAEGSASGAAVLKISWATPL